METGGEGHGLWWDRGGARSALKEAVGPGTWGGSQWDSSGACVAFSVSPVLEAELREAGCPCPRHARPGQCGGGVAGLPGLVVAEVVGESPAATCGLVIVWLYIQSPKTDP